MQVPGPDPASRPDACAPAPSPDLTFFQVPGPDPWRQSLESAAGLLAVVGLLRFLLDDFTLSVKAKDLNEAVKADGYEVEEGSFFTAGYDPVGPQFSDFIDECVRQPCFNFFVLTCILLRCRCS